MPRENNPWSEAQSSAGGPSGGKREPVGNEKQSKRDSPAPGFEPLRVVMVSSEAHPFAKTGGLAEVVGALPLALARLGHDVTIVLPKYRGIATDGLAADLVTLPFAARQLSVALLERPLADGVRAVFVDVPELFDRDGLYGNAGGDYPDNARRFAVFSRAALEHARLRRLRPSIVHAHDWQAGLVPVYLKTRLASDPVVGGVASVFTIHNLAFQGLFPSSTLPSVDLGWDLFHVDALEYWGKISYLKGGINFSDKITTVSPRYAEEILASEFGFGFDGVLSRRARDLVGIVNGIDVERWNPGADPFIAAPYGETDLSGKRANKRALLEKTGLTTSEGAIARPLIGLISRLTDQKGFDLLADATPDLMALDATWVMLGSGDARHEEHWRRLADRHADRVAAIIGFDEALAHQIEAGSDMFLMPSRFEPCGLNQMYSVRYGTVPIVRAVGGLDDTVIDADEYPRDGTGFKFRDYTPAALLDALRRALDAFSNLSRWNEIRRTGMRQDHSWDASAAEYVKVYRASLQSSARTRVRGPA